MPRHRPRPTAPQPDGSGTRAPAQKGVGRGTGLPLPVLYYGGRLPSRLPLVSLSVPHRIVPETVLLIIGGVLIGPSGLGAAAALTPIEFKELGVAFLFLMAGYEIDVNELRGSGDGTRWWPGWAP